MLLIHHANKKGAQRGTSQREDLLDLVMAMRRPPDYDPRQGARFQIHFEKARGLIGDAVTPIEAHMTTDEIGGVHWHWRPANQSDLERMAALLNEGLTPAQIARELKFTRGRAYRLHAKAVAAGLVEK